MSEIFSDANLEFTKVFQNVAGKIVGWVETLIEMTPNMVAAVIILIVAWLVAKLVAGTVDKAMNKAYRHDELRILIVRIVRIAVIIAGLTVALGVMELQKTVASMLAGVGVIGLALGFAFQDIAANFMSGIIIAIRQPFHVDDLIDAAGFHGFVEKITLRSTEGRTFQGQKVIIPNKDMLNTNIINYTEPEKRRVDIECGVAYWDDLEKVQKVATEAVAAIEPRMQEHPVEVYFKEFGASSINFVLRVWIDPRQKTFLEARSEAIKKIKQAFDENDITIPFPIRTLDFDENQLKQFSGANNAG